jgi:hypothetical protein
MENRETLELMDLQAGLARLELEENIDLWSGRAIALWWDRWYLKAGHKRLGRILVEMAKK